MSTDKGLKHFQRPWQRLSVPEGRQIDNENLGFYITRTLAIYGKFNCPQL